MHPTRATASSAPVLALVMIPSAQAWSSSVAVTCAPPFSSGTERRLTKSFLKRNRSSYARVAAASSAASGPTANSRATKRLTCGAIWTTRLPRATGPSDSGTARYCSHSRHSSGSAAATSEVNAR